MIDSPKRWATNADDMKHATSRPDSSESTDQSMMANAPSVIPAYAVNPAAILFMCSPGTSPAQKPSMVPNEQEIRIDRTSPNSATS